MRGKWKAVELDPCLFSEEGLEGLVCFEELTDYRLVDSENAAAKDQKKKKAKKRKIEESGEAGENQDAESTSEPAKKKGKKSRKNKKTVPNKATESDDKKEVTQEHKSAKEEEDKTEASKETADVPEHTQPSKTSKKDKRNKNKFKQQTDTEKHSDLNVSKEPNQEKQTKPSKQRTNNWTHAALSASHDTSCDVSTWKNLFVPSPVLKALSRLGFSSPTPIQALVLPPAIRDRLNILGAAETGKIQPFFFLFKLPRTLSKDNVLMYNYRKW